MINRPSSVCNELPASRLPLTRSQRGLWRQVRVAALRLFADTEERRRGCGAAARVVVVIYRFSEAFASPPPPTELSSPGSTHVVRRSAVVRG